MSEASVIGCTEAAGQACEEEPRRAGPVFVFRCRRCGNCCRHEGYVFLRTEETERIAEHLGLTVYEFTDRYTHLPPERFGLSLVEKPDGSCVFLSEQNQCRIHAVKPEQCREFPFKWCLPEMRATCRGIQEIVNERG